MPDNPRIDMWAFAWPDPDRGPWWVRVHIDVSLGVPRCVGLDMRSFRGDPDVPSRPPSLGPLGLEEMSTKVLRSVSLPTFVATAMEGLTKLYDGTAEGVILEMPTDLTADQIQQRRSAYDRGGRRYGLDHYEAVADTYERALRDGSPTRAVAEKFHISRSAAAKQVARCRELGLLEPTRKGRAGGRKVTKP